MVLLPAPAGPSMAMISLQVGDPGMAEVRLILHGAVIFGHFWSLNHEGHEGKTFSGFLRVPSCPSWLRLLLRVLPKKNSLDGWAFDNKIALRLLADRMSPMNFALALAWPQPLDPLHNVALSAVAAVIPLVVVLILMGVLRKSGLLASACGLASAGILALVVWEMPARLALWSVIYGLAYAVWPILWIVFTALWLYNLCCDTGKIELLRRWMEHHASGDACIQAILVAFCFGSLIEGTAGFGAPVAMTAFLLVGLGFQPRRAVVVSLISNTAPVAFGSLGIPIVALAG